MKARDYIDAIKARHNLPSDYAAAKALGVTRSAVSKYRSGADSFADHVALRAASLLEIDPGEILIDCQMERAPDPATRAAWGALLARLGGHAAVVIFGALLVLQSLIPAPAMAAELPSTAEKILLVTVFRTRKIRSFLACFFSGLFRLPRFQKLRSDTIHSAPTHDIILPLSTSPIIMKRATFLALAVALTACAQAPITSPAGFYRPRGADDQLQITATISPESVFSSDRTITILIDGSPAASGPSNRSFSSTWRSRKIEADCHHGGGVFTGLTAATLSLVGADRPDVRCMVFINGERAASLALPR